MSTNGQTRVLVVHPPTSERRILVAGLLELGIDVALADDAGRAVRALDGVVDALLVRASERRLALKQIVRSAPSVRLFVVGSPAEAEELGASLQVEAEALSGEPEEMALALGKSLGLGGEEEASGPTLVTERGLWSSPRGSVEAAVARKKEEDTRVAVLMTRCGWADDWRDAYVTNMKRANDLQHAHLGKVELAWTQDTDVHSLWSLPAGAPLIDELGGNTMDVDVAMAMTKAFVTVLQAMHGADVLFGPVTPQQIWMTPQGPIFLFAGASRIAYNFDRVRRGRAQLAIPIIASPEEISGAGASAPSDTFYAGVFLHQLLTGSEPYPRQNVSGYVEAIRTGGFRDIKVYMPGLDDDVATALNQCFAVDPAQRPSLPALAEALTMQAPEATEPAEPQKKKWQFWKR